MVKIPDGAERSNDPEAIARRTQFLHDYGLLIQVWNHMELNMEVEIQRITGLSGLHFSIMLGGLMAKAKRSILFALLRDDGRADAIPKIKTALIYAKRNALMHGNIATEEDNSEIVFFHRSVDDDYKVVCHRFTPETFSKHVWEFSRLVDEALLALGYDDDDPLTKARLDAFGKAAQFDGLN